jgi:seryl-tRNA synthetase
MSYAFYEDLAGLRTWRQGELRLRRRIAEALLDTTANTLCDINRAWAFEEIEAPLMMPVDRMSSAYTADDVFMLQDAPGGTKQWALRAETTDGTYVAAAHILRSTNVKPPLCLWQMGTSFRRERSDGATAEKLRFNAFTQMEMQCILSEDSAFDIAPPLREALMDAVRQITGCETRLIESDRLPAYSTETVDIECLLPNGEWREVASTSRRTDFPTPPGLKPLKVVEFAFGMDRMVAIANGKI